MSVNGIPNMNKQPTSNEAFKQRIQETMRYYFTFPILGVQIEYRRPDLLKLSYNNYLPSAIAVSVIDAYKEAIGGTDMEEYQAKIANQKHEANDELVKDLSAKGYVLLSELCISQRIMDVPQSDLDNGVVSWNDIPEEDAMAFLMHVVKSAQVARTKSGGEVSAEDITTFPDEGRVTKRNTSRANGKAVRTAA